MGIVENCFCINNGTILCFTLQFSLFLSCLLLFLLVSSISSLILFPLPLNVALTDLWLFKIFIATEVQIKVQLIQRLLGSLLWAGGWLFQRLVQFLMGNSNMNPQVPNVGEFQMANVTLQLLFINKLLEVFFEMTKSLVSLEIIPGWESFLEEMAFVLGGFVIDGLSLWNVNRRIQKLLDLVVCWSDVLQQIPQFMDHHSTNIAGSFLLVDELPKTSREVASAVVAIKLSSTLKWFVITETTEGLVSGSSWDRLRLWADWWPIIILSWGRILYLEKLRRGVNNVPFSTTFLSVGVRNSIGTEVSWTDCGYKPK